MSGRNGCGEPLSIGSLKMLSFALCGVTLKCNSGGVHRWRTRMDELFSAAARRYCCQTEQSLILD